MESQSKLPRTEGKDSTRTANDGSMPLFGMLERDGEAEFGEVTRGMGTVAQHNLYATTIILAACRGLNGPTSLDVSRDDFTKPEIQAPTFFDPHLRPNAPASIRVPETSSPAILDKFSSFRGC